MAKHLAQHGAEVHLWGVVKRCPARRADEINQVCGAQRAFFQPVDIRQYADFGRCGDRGHLGKAWARSPALINNAAANFIAPTKDPSPRGYEAIRSTVMDGAFHHAGLRQALDRTGHQGISGVDAGDLI